MRLLNGLSRENIGENQDLCERFRSASSSTDRDFAARVGDMVTAICGNTLHLAIDVDVFSMFYSHASVDWAWQIHYNWIVTIRRN